MFKRIDHVEITARGHGEGVGLLYKSAQLLHQHRQAGRPDTPWKEIVFLQLDDTQLEVLTSAVPCEAPPAQERSGYRMMAIEVDDMDKTPVPD